MNGIMGYMELYRAKVNNGLLKLLIEDLDCMEGFDSELEIPLEHEEWRRLKVENLFLKLENELMAYLVKCSKCRCMGYASKL